MLLQKLPYFLNIQFQEYNMFKLVNKYLIATLIPLVLFTSYVKAEQDSAQQIRDTQVQVGKDFLKNDANLIASYFTHDAQIIFNGFGVIKDEALVDFWQATLDIGNKVKFTSKEINALGDTAVEYGNYTLQNGAKLVDSGKYISIWKKQGNTLKIHRYMVVSTRNKAESVKGKTSAASY